MKIGYARVSTIDQNLDLQLDALKACGCERVYQEHASGKSAVRPELSSVLKALRAGDSLVVWRLDRLGRSLPDLIRIVSELETQGIGFASLTESIDTSSANGRFIFNVFASLASFERDLIRERTQAGLSAARARGRVGGRPAKLQGKDLAMARALMADKSSDVTAIAKQFQVSRTTLYRVVKAEIRGGEGVAVENGI